MSDNQQDLLTNSLVTDKQSEDEFLRVTAAHQTLIEGKIFISLLRKYRSLFSSSTNL